MLLLLIGDGVRQRMETAKLRKAEDDPPTPAELIREHLFRNAPRPATAIYPINVTGDILGQWKVEMPGPSPTVRTPSDNVSVALAVPEDVINRPPPISKRNTDSWRFRKSIRYNSSGTYRLKLWRRSGTKTPSVSVLQGSLAVVVGPDVDRGIKLWQARLLGVYLANSGRLTLFSNVLGYSLFLRGGLHNEAELVSAEGDMWNVSKFSNALANMSGIPADGITHHADSGEATTPCVFRLDFNVAPLSEMAGVEPEALSPAYKGKSNIESVIKLNGTLSSPLNCKLESSVMMKGMGVQLNLQKTVASARAYCALLFLSTIMQVSFHVKHLQHSAAAPLIRSVSIFTMVMQAILDATIAITHLWIALVVDELFSWFIIVATIKLTLFSVFELRYVVRIWQARYPQAFFDTFITRRETNMMFSKFYCALIFLASLLYIFGWILPAVVFVLYSFWVPQIISNAVYDETNGIGNEYIWGMSLTRLYVPFYVWLYSDPFMGASLRLESRPWLVLALVFWLTLQISLLFCQRQHGARFFVPKQFIPPKYNYYRPLPQAMVHQIPLQGETLNCPICMCDVIPGDENYMITPCNHIFHGECLRRWLGEKLECPVCRAGLPPVDGDEEKSVEEV